MKQEHLPKQFAILLCSFLFAAFPFNVLADDPASKVREGLRQYAAEQFEEASKSFANATESLEESKSDKAAVSAFDEACALHRKGDLDLARDRYLKAGLSQDKEISTRAHFNLGLIASEQARKLAGETPEAVPAEKRTEILSEIRKSIDSYRHCLELQPKHVPARRNLELLRQWTKYYTDRWREADLQKRRDETNLIQFVEYLMEAQLALKESVKDFRSNTSPNAFAEMKRLQSELREEIPYLKDKIDSDLRPKESDSPSAAPTPKDPRSDEELERGIALLSGWADEAASKMVAAEKELSKREANAAAENQQRAADQLDRIWDAVVPFHPLLAKELAEQTQIVKQISPPTAPEEVSKIDPTNESENQPQTLDANENEWPELLAKQERALRKTRLLEPKAEFELAQVESQPKADETTIDMPPVDLDPATPTAPKVDPEAIKAGYQKALELAPKAVEQMESAVKQIGNRDRSKVAIHAEEARRILQEIQDAQPKNPQQDQQDQNKDENKEQQQNQNKEDKKDGEGKDPKDEKDKQEDQENDKKDKQNDKKQDDKKQGDDEKKEKEEKGEPRQEPKVSQDRIEEALRRVREREQEKRERDRNLKARVLGRVPVDKDW